MPGLGTSLGRGAATGTQQDLANSDCILIMGSNMAEAHPVGFRFPMKARERGATLIHVDPHFTRTSASCNMYVPIRTGSDIAFLGGLINYVLKEEKWFREYVLAYTNATTLITDEFQDTEDLDGLFGGFDEKLARYSQDTAQWKYSGEPGGGTQTQTPADIKAESFSERLGSLQNPNPPSDPTLADPRCVLNILRRHFSRYTPEAVASACGCTSADFLRVAETLCANSGRDRTSAIVYAVGWTQHTTGVQIIRAASILQLLLGNIGRP
ncbi:MAG: fdnG, partial [Bryobacterales bacterium]|nr:fdnG [Bryobacterales bacterium]